MNNVVYNVNNFYFTVLAVCLSPNIDTFAVLPSDIFHKRTWGATSHQLQQQRFLSNLISIYSCKHLTLGTKLIHTI